MTSQGDIDRDLSDSLDSPEQNPERQVVLDEIAGQILRIPYDRYLRVAVDGVDGAGKTFFAGELAKALEMRGASVVHASIDGFHNPRAERYRQGRSSPAGFFEDSFNYDSMIWSLLEPFGSDGDGRFVRAIYDVAKEEPVEAVVELASPGTILVVDGIFLHCPDLMPFWDYSVFLDVEFNVSIPRLAARDSMSPDPAAESNRRYVEGQRIYMEACNPRRQATTVVDNNDLAQPRLLNSPS